MNLYFQKDLFRKRARWTPSSEQITFIRDQTDLGRLWNHLEDNTPWPNPKGYRWGRLAPPVGRSASPGPPSASASYVGFLPSSRFNLCRCSRSVPIEGSDLMLPWIHGPTEPLVPPINSTPYPPKASSESREIIIIIKEEKNLRAPQIF